MWSPSWSWGSVSYTHLDVYKRQVKVYEDESLESLAKGAGHFKFTSYWDGNVGLAGHNRGIAYHFGQIHTLESGDKNTPTISGRSYWATLTPNLCWAPRTMCQQSISAPAAAT